MWLIYGVLGEPFLCARSSPVARYYWPCLVCDVLVGCSSACCVLVDSFQWGRVRLFGSERFMCNGPRAGCTRPKVLMDEFMSGQVIGDLGWV